MVELIITELNRYKSTVYLLVGGVEVLKKYNFFKVEKTASQTKFNS